MRVHPRVALFIWKVAWGCLPTRSLLARRGMRISQCCEECADIEKTIKHILLQCPRAREIWRRSPVPLPASAASTQDLIHLLRDSTRCPRSAEAGIFGAYLSYHIWLDRNAGLFKGRRSPSRVVVDRAMLLAREVIGAAAVVTSGLVRNIWCAHHAVSAPRFALVSWAPPSVGYLKVNFDGSRSLDGMCGGVGFVIGDHLGRMIVAGGRRTPGLTVVGAELQAAWECISYARQVLGAERCVPRE